MISEETGRLLNAYLDGELDPVNSRDFEAQLAASAELRAALESMRGQSAAIRAVADYHVAPESLRARIGAAAQPAERVRGVRARWWRGAAALALVALASVALTLWFVRPGADRELTADLLASHVRATLDQRLYDVASSDQHTVKPWLSARLPYSPPVNDFSGHGFDLLGARVDFVGGRQVAVLVYKRRQHVVDVFVWPDPTPAPGGTLTREGFNVESLSRDGMRFFLVSDLNRNELGDLARLLAAHAAAP